MTKSTRKPGRTRLNLWIPNDLLEGVDRLAVERFPVWNRSRTTVLWACLEHALGPQGFGTLPPAGPHAQALEAAENNGLDLDEFQDAAAE